MTKLLFILFFFTQISVLAQPKIKKVLIEGKGTPILMLNGGVADMSVFAVPSKELASKYKVIRWSNSMFNTQRVD